MKKWTVFLLTLLGLIAACNSPAPKEPVVTPAQSRSIETILTEMASATEEAIALIQDTPEASPPAAAENAKTLDVCLGNEPASLFIYQGISNAGWAILDSIYDGPFDMINGESSPVLFDNVGTASVDIPVNEGDLIVNANGEPQILAAGVSIIPSNGIESCGFEFCTLVWDSSKQATMAQTEISFTLKSGVKWSDGEPLTAADSIYSWKLSSDPELGSSKDMVELTDTYQEQDDLTVFWKGIPGFVPQQPADVFWLPLPAHTMETMTIEAILADEMINRTPLGWGAYRIAEWIPGQSLKAVRNEYYSGGLQASQPYFEGINYHFFGNSGDNNLSALASGTCDVIDSSVDLQTNLEPVLEDVRDGKYSIYIHSQASWEQLTFNFAPLNENGYSFVNQSNVRNGIAQCLDRQTIIRQVFYGQSEVPVGFYPTEHLLYSAGSTVHPFDSAAGAVLLENAGWIDHDQDASTPRIAAGIPGIPDGTEFSITLETADSAIKLKTAELIREQLAVCGIAVTIRDQTTGEIYSPGPEGSVFGRKFDLVIFAWASGTQTPCTLYQSNSIPSEANLWVGTNVGGFQSDQYDIACNAARNNSATEFVSQLAIQQIYSEALPAIPLYFYPDISVSANTICGIQSVDGMRSILWNVESLSESDTVCAASQWNNIYPE